jgi:hypothetical protein
MLIESNHSITYDPVLVRMPPLVLVRMPPLLVHCKKYKNGKEK